MTMDRQETVTEKIFLDKASRFILQRQAHGAAAKYRSCFCGLFKGWLVLALLIVFQTSPSFAETSSQQGLTNTIVTAVDPAITTLSNNPWIKGIIVIALTILLASLVTWLVFGLLKKFTRNTRIRLDDQIVTHLRVPIYITLLAIGIYAGVDLMPLSERIDMLVERIIQTISVVIWIAFFTQLATLILRRLADLGSRTTLIQHRTLTLFDNGAKILIFGLGIYGFFVIWHIDMTAWLASAGIVGIAVGFAAKDTLSNLFSGVFILADAPYKVGDYIVLDNADRGKVMNIGLRSTRILTRDDVEITIPNSIIGNSTIINQSGGFHTRMRLRVKVGVAYGSDIDQVRRVLLDVAIKDPIVCSTPEPRVRFRLFGASSLDFELLCWVNDPELRGQAMDSLNEAIYKQFIQEKIEIPYSKHDLYIKEIPLSRDDTV